MINLLVLLCAAFLTTSCVDYSKPILVEIEFTECSDRSLTYEQSLKRLDAQALVMCLGESFVKTQAVENTQVCSSWIHLNHTCYDGSTIQTTKCSGYYKCESKNKPSS
jgi:hypothetical protein